MSKESESSTAFFEIKTNRGISQYYDFNPRAPDFAVKPFTPKDVLLTV